MCWGNCYYKWTNNSYLNFVKFTCTKILQLMDDPHYKKMEVEEVLSHYCFVFLVVFCYTFHLFGHMQWQHMLMGVPSQCPYHLLCSQNFALGDGDDWKMYVEPKDIYHTAMKALESMLKFRMGRFYNSIQHVTVHNRYF